MFLSRRHFLCSSATLALLASSNTLAQHEAARSTHAVRIRRQYIRVGLRDIYYMNAGEGAPVVLLHGSPGDSSFFDDDIPELATRYAVYAFDSPGFGRSEPPPEAERDISFMADRIAGAMRALQLPPAVVYGSHTGAAVAMELAARQPDVVRALMLDGVPIFNDHELGTWFEGFFPPLVPDAQGGHFLSVWTRCRDQGVWFPWSYKAPDHYLGNGLPSPAQIHRVTMRIMRCGRTYVKAFRSAVLYGPRVPATLARIRQPTMICCAEGDPLAPHLNRLPPLRANQSVRLLKSGDDVRALREQWLLPLAGDSRALSVPNKAPAESGISAHILELADGREVFMRVAGKPDAPALLLLHDAPGSSKLHELLIEALSAHARVYGVDLPGCGETNPFSMDAPTLADFADVVRSVIVALGLKRAAVYGIGFGSAVALELTARSPEVVETVVLQSVPLPSPEERADMLRNYAPSIELKADGSHWYMTWLMLRDSLVFWPWYKNASRDRLRRVDLRGDFDAERLHDRTVEVMKQYGSYQHVINAALGQDALPLLRALKGKVVLCTDSTHQFTVYDEALVATRPNTPMLEKQGDLDMHAAHVARFIKV